ncbi:hypothetical protein P7H75_05785 [Vagococcus carniphilus]|uniref:hypothetical protein n=1 Tax=Vagococcus carniphilus TaxID=218144 RepID=UPI00288FF939|nr:hypothetical protein [Vagococcus carniphilus]MDT2814350.1 hypothetical protein [Vagococcus carniphilus]
MKISIDFWSLLLGIVSSLIIPVITSTVKYFNNKKSKKEFINLIRKEYVEPLTSSYVKTYSAEQYKERLKGEIGEVIKRLEYLKKNELIYLTTENQFYFLRVVEYTLSLQKHIQDIADEYEFTDTTIKEPDYHKTKLVRNKVMDEIQSYEKNVKKYAELKLNSFISTNT